MAEEAKVCEHTETELQAHNIRHRGWSGYYVECKACGLVGPKHGDAIAAREAWANMLECIPKENPVRIERQKEFGAQLDIGKRAAAAMERIAAALEKIADKP